jgi:hypothetical protein
MKALVLLPILLLAACGVSPQNAECIKARVAHDERVQNTIENTTGASTEIVDAVSNTVASATAPNCEVVNVIANTVQNQTN